MRSNQERYAADEMAEAARALEFIPPDPESQWWKVGVCLKYGLGDDAYSLWERWSAKSPSFPGPERCRKKWDRIKKNYYGLGSLYHLAQSYGYVRSSNTPPPVQTQYQPDPREAEKRQEAAKQAAVLATSLLDSGEYMEHSYLDAHGFVGQKGLVIVSKKSGKNLMLSMTAFRTGKTQAVQLINEQGDKLFYPPNCELTETVHILGQHTGAGPVFWVEGYATGLSVLAALKQLYQNTARVICTFTASNLGKMGSKYRMGVVVADHDWYTCTGCKQKLDLDWGTTRCPECDSRLAPPAGEAYARETGLPFWMPATPGWDANDVHRYKGLDFLAEALRPFLLSARRRYDTEN